ncbi:sulfatase [Akkermansiaceae bacterium]|nr:sulfatase [Akkermansiaceae bacterium]
MSKTIAILLTLAPIASKAQVKNVLFLISDDLKASALACYENKICATPHIDRLAARGMVFDRAYCQGTWCQPSRTSLMHSRYTGSEGKNLAAQIRSHGVFTARVGKIFHMKVPGDIIAGSDGEDIPGSWDEKFNPSGKEAHTPGLYALLNKNIFTREMDGRQTTAMPHRMFVSVEAGGDGSDQPDWKAADLTNSLLKRHAGKPFFIATGFVRPHYPNVAPKDLFARYPFADMPLPIVPENDLADIPKPGQGQTLSQQCGIDQYPDNIRRMWAAYYATVTFMDAQLGKILDELDRLGLTDSTAIVFTSDHGYHLGEHHFWQKSDLHEEVTRVPLIIAIPGMKPGRTNSLAELTDIYPTICETLKLPIPETVQGKSLLPILKDPSTTIRKAALSLNGKHHALRTARWAYMRYADGSEELYDMEKDPGQFTNLARTEKPLAALTEMREMLEARLAK